MPDIMVGGDFNLPNTSWPECEPKQGCPKEEREMINLLQNFSNDLLLNQIILDPTHHKGNTLDLVLTNNDALVHSQEIQPTTRSISDHYMVRLFTQYKAPKLLSQDEKSPRLSAFDELNYQSKEVNWEDIATPSGSPDWVSDMASKTVDQMLDLIYKKSLVASTDHVPIRQEQNNKKISKQKRLCMNLARRRRRINPSLIHISEPTRPLYISYAVFCLKKQNPYKHPCTHDTI